MIKLRNLICEIIAERMSYNDLMNNSDPNRIDRAKSVSTKPLIVRSVNDREAWKFSYKTTNGESTTNERHQGFIYFFKNNIAPGDNAMTIDCSVDCSCPDYKNRLAYNNNKQGAGEIGSNSLNKNNGAAPMINIGPGLCKHLIALKEYLNTNIKSEPVVNKQPNDVKPVITPAPKKQNVTADDEPAEPVDKTQSPNPESEEPTDDPLTTNDPNVDKTQTPEGPEEPEVSTDDVDANDPLDKENPEKTPIEKNPNKKLKEGMVTDKNKIIQRLNDICKTKKLFIIHYE